MGIYQLTDRIIDPTRYPWGFHQLWTPGFITTALWLDAADSATVTLVDGAVSQWADKSGNGRHATQGTADARPAIASAELNGKDVLRFDGAGDYLGTASSVLGSSHDMFIVCKATETLDTALAQWSTGAAGRYLAIQFHANPTGGGSEVIIGSIKSFLEPTGHLGVSDVINTTDYFLINVAKNAGTHIRYWVDGVLKYTTGSVGANVEQKSLTIGSASDSGVSFFAGDMAEIVILNSIANESDRQKLEGYLAHKWGLTANLPSDHPYKTYAPRV